MRLKLSSVPTVGILTICVDSTVAKCRQTICGARLLVFSHPWPRATSSIHPEARRAPSRSSLSTSQESSASQASGQPREVEVWALSSAIHVRHWQPFHSPHRPTPHSHTGVSEGYLVSGLFSDVSLYILGLPTVSCYSRPLRFDPLRTVDVTMHSVFTQLRPSICSREATPNDDYGSLRALSKGASVDQCLLTRTYWTACCRPRSRVPRRNRGVIQVGRRLRPFFPIQITSNYSIYLELPSRVSANARLESTHTKYIWTPRV